MNALASCGSPFELARFDQSAQVNHQLWLEIQRSLPSSEDWNNALSNDMVVATLLCN